MGERKEMGRWDCIRSAAWRASAAFEAGRGGEKTAWSLWGKEFVPYLGQDDTNSVSSLNVLCDVRKWGTFRRLNLVFAVDPQE